MTSHEPLPDRAGDAVASDVDGVLRAERWALLARVTRTLEPVMVALSAAWIALLIADLANQGLPRSLEVLVWVIWGIFAVDFALKLLIAPSRSTYLKRNWLTVLSLVLPAFRVLRIATAFRVLRAARVARSVGLLRVVTSLNRGLGALGRTAQRRGFGYVVAATALVMIVGAAAMSYLEASPAAAGGAESFVDTAFDDYGEALWWTANTMTTGPTAMPRTPEARLFGWLLSVYGLAVFGYLTAILASHFVGQDGVPAGGGGTSLLRGEADGPTGDAPASTGGRRRI